MSDIAIFGKKGDPGPPGPVGPAGPPGPIANFVVPEEITFNHVISFAGPIQVQLVPADQPERGRIRARATLLDAHLNPKGIWVEGEEIFMQIHDDEGVQLGPITGLDAKGNPAPVQNITASVPTNGNDANGVALPAPAVTVDMTDPVNPKVLAAGPLATGAVVQIDGQGAGGAALTPFTLSVDVIAEGAVTMNVPVGNVFKQP